MKERYFGSIHLLFANHFAAAESVGVEFLSRSHHAPSKMVTGTEFVHA